MAFQKIITLTLETATAQKMSEYVDIFIRTYNIDPTPMTNLEKENFIKDKFLKYLKNTIKAQSDLEKRNALILEDVENTMTGV